MKETEYRPCRDISTPGGKIQFVSFFDALLSLGCSFKCLLVSSKRTSRRIFSVLIKDEKKREGKKKKEKKIKEFLLCVVWALDDD